MAFMNWLCCDSFMGGVGWGSSGSPQIDLLMGPADWWVGVGVASASASASLFTAVTISSQSIRGLGISVVGSPVRCHSSSLAHSSG